MPDPPDARERATLLSMIHGYRVSAVLQAAATLHIADHLADGPKTGAELADVTGADAATLPRILRVLAVLRIIDETEPGCFALAALGELLRENAPGSLRRTAMQVRGDTMRVWGELLHTVRTGETTFDHVHGMSSFDYFARDPAVSKGFNEQMGAGTRAALPAILAAYDFSQFRTIVDVGGGNGTLLAAILNAHPRATGIVCDSAAGLAEAPGVLQATGVSARCRAETIDFFESVPAGGDLYILKSVIHDWDDARAVTILKNCRGVMPGDGKLVVMEAVVPARAEASEPARGIAMADLNMLVNTGGRERTEAEFRELFASSGFAVTRILPTGSPWPLSIIEGAPV